MRPDSESFKTVCLPKTRRAISDILNEGQKKHMVHGLTEMDVTEARHTIREVLCVTVSLDHDIVDGAPAARFTQRLKELVEGCHGLHEESRSPAN